ncbi:MAG TPA: prolyl oligopeptidase family serine peptidase [Steroidobacteraceae bacterium]
MSQSKATIHGSVARPWSLVTLTSLACSVCLAAGARLTYPPAARGPVVDRYFGISVPDPYRWLEDLDSAATRSWVAAQKSLTDSYLSSLSGRSVIAAGISRLSNFERFGVPFREGSRYLYTRNTGLQDQSVLYSMQSLSGGPSVALDPNSLSRDGSLAVVGYRVSHDGGTLAYGVSVSGSDWTQWRFRDLASGKDLPEILRYTKYYPPVFTRDGKGVYYSAFPAPPAGKELSAQDSGNALYFHKLGTPVTADRRMFADNAHPDWQYEPHLSSEGRWLVVEVGQGEVGDTGHEDVYVFDLDHPGATPIPIVKGFESSYVYAGTDRGRVYFLTTLGAPLGRVIAVDPRQASQDHWVSVLPQTKDAIPVTEPSVSLVDHQLIVRSLHDAHSRVVIYGLDGKLRREVQLPGPGTAEGFEGEPDQKETFYTFTDLITPPTVYRYDLESGVATVFRSPKVAFDPRAFEEHQVFYQSKDGTRIPMLLAYRKGIKPDGRNAVLLYGYGGFGIPVLPSFRAAHIEWLEMGGIYAVANIRGGGEYGDQWHRQAIRGHKQLVFDDFIAAGEWLISQHYTSREKLAILGASNGGLLIGACLTQRPDLWGAAIAEVGVMDMLRFDRFGQGAGWTGDYGSPHDPEDFKALIRYSPVHNVHAGTRYPATLVVTGDHDTRVMPMHSFKFAAALQTAQAGPAPVLLYIESSSGHGGGPTVRQEVNQTADIYAFLSNSLGMSAPH